MNTNNEGSIRFKYRLLEFVQEDNGSLSATRLAFLLWVIGVLSVWIIDSVMKGALQPVSSDIATIIGILMTGKVVQKFGEKGVPDENADQPDQKDKAADHSDTPKGSDQLATGASRMRA